MVFLWGIVLCFFLTAQVKLLGGKAQLGNLARVVDPAVKGVIFRGNIHFLSLSPDDFTAFDGELQEKTNSSNALLEFEMFN